MSVKNSSDSSSDEDDVSILDEDWLTSDNIVLEEVFLSKDSSDVTRTRKYKGGSDSENNNSASDTSGDVEDWFGGDDDVEEIRKASDTSAEISPPFPGKTTEMDDIKFKVDENSISLASQKELFNQLCTIPDLRFETLKPEMQLQLMNSIKIIALVPGETFIREGDEDSGAFYMIFGPPQAQVEVLKNVDGKEEFLTRINAGQYFGEKYFITNRPAPRNATIRAVGACTLGAVYPENFSVWSHFRTFLLMKEVPLIRTLPQNFQVDMYSLLKLAVFDDGDYIVKQGDVGDKFYIITDGAADVVQEKFENGNVDRKTLVRLYEGHFFGEMALVFDEPRVASVFAVGKTSCLYLSKSAFTKALSAEQFQIMMQDVAYQRAEVREKREQKEQAALAAKETLNRITSSQTDSQVLSMSSIATIAPLLNRVTTGSSVSGNTRHNSVTSGWDSDYAGSDNERNVTTTKKLIKRKLSTGQKFINKYIILKTLGHGAFGYVYLCQSADDDQLYAMKSISKATRKWSMKLTDDIKTEIAVMKNLRHQNVVSLLEVIDDPNAKQIYLIQEYMEGGPLLGDELNAEPIPESKVWNYFRDMLRGVSYMHSQGIVHRDIKPQNMLRSADDVVKLADFGTAALTGGDDGTVVLAAGGTPAFMAPELFQVASKDSNETHARVVSPQVDVWGLGATLYTLVIGNPPWMARNQIQLAEMVMTIELRFPYEKERSMDPHMKHLIKRMLDKDPKTRITMSEICEHDWVTREGSEPLDEDYLYNLLNPENLAALGGISKAISQLNSSFSTPQFSLTSSKTSTEPSQSQDSQGSQEDVFVSVRNRGKSSSFSAKMRMKSLSNLIDDNDDDNDDLPPDRPRMQRLPSTKHQQFVAKKTDITTDTGEVVTSVQFTNRRYSATSTLESSTSATWNKNVLSDNSENSDDIEGGVIIDERRNSASVSSAKLLQSFRATKISSPVDFLSGTMDDMGDMTAVSDAYSDSSVERSPVSSWKIKKKKKKSIKKDSIGSSSSSNHDDSYSPIMNKRSLSSKKFKQMEDSSDDDIVTLDDDDLDDMLDTLCEVVPKNQSLSLLSDKGIGDLMLEKRSNTPLFQVKTWAGQTNLTLGVRYGVAEMRNGRPYMEDRTTACASFHDANIKKNALLTLSEVASDNEEEIVSSRPLSTGRDNEKCAEDASADFSFFAVYDGHEGEYVSEYLQNNFHFRFNEKLQLNGGLPTVSNTSTSVEASHNEDYTVRLSLLETFCAMEREILAKDHDRLQSALVSRVNFLNDGDDSTSESGSDSSNCTPPVVVDSTINDERKSNDGNKRVKNNKFKDSGSAKFAGSTAVVAILYSTESFCGDNPKLSVSSSRPPDQNVLGSSLSSMTCDTISDTTYNTSIRVKRMGSYLSTIEEPENSKDSQDMADVEETDNKSVASSTASPLISDSRLIKMIIAHVGDCRAVLCERGVAVQLTEDHHAAVPSEKTRIEAAGGWISKNRVNGVLAVSRSFGDIMFKTFKPNIPAPEFYGDEEETDGIWANQNQVISMPDILELDVQPTYEFVVLGSDGIFEVFSCAGIVSFVRDELFKHGDAQRAARAAIKEVEGQGGQDNTSIVVICLNQVARDTKTPLATPCKK